jgi:hypothetical protein
LSLHSVQRGGGVGILLDGDGVEGVRAWSVVVRIALEDDVSLERIGAVVGTR